MIHLNKFVPVVGWTATIWSVAFTSGGDEMFDLNSCHPSNIHIDYFPLCNNLTGIISLLVPK